MAPKKKAPAKEGEEDLLANYDRDYKKLCRQSPLFVDITQFSTCGFEQKLGLGLYEH